MSSLFNLGQTGKLFDISRMLETKYLTFMSTGIFITIVLCNHAIINLFCNLSTLSIDCWHILEMQTVCHLIYVCLLPDKSQLEMDHR